MGMSAKMSRTSEKTRPMNSATSGVYADNAAGGVYSGRRVRACLPKPRASDSRADGRCVEKCETELLCEEW